GGKGGRVAGAYGGGRGRGSLPGAHTPGWPARLPPGFATLFRYATRGGDTRTRRVRESIRMTLPHSPLAGAQESTEARRRRRIEAFHPSYRRSIREVSDGAPAVEDLAESFPALLFALSTQFGSKPRRELSLAVICGGPSRRQAGEALGLPGWLRKVPARAFTEPLAAFPGGDDYSLRIASLIPRLDTATVPWLKRVGQAQDIAGNDYALWMARQSELASWPDEVFDFMAAWAWDSRRPELVGSRLV